MKKNKEQFTPIPHSLLSRKDLTDQDKTTLAIIYSFIENDKECFIGNDRLGDMLGITRKAASKRILRLESIGCIKLNYTYKDNQKSVDKRYITFISFVPQETGCLPVGDRVSPESGQGVSPQTTGVSPKGGGIIQPSLLNNLLNKLPDNITRLEELNKLIEVDIFDSNEERGLAYMERNKLELELKQNKL